jgi:hypothetical protein
VEKVRHFPCITIYNTYDSESTSAESPAPFYYCYCTISPIKLVTPSPANPNKTGYNSIATLNLQQHATGVLDVLLDLDEELHCLPAV